jgi:uncharacterized protein (TIGR04255 family)
MYSDEARCIYEKNQLIEVICQLRFPDILKIEAQEPFEFQDAVRGEYPTYNKNVEQLPPQNVNGKTVPQGTVNNYQFIAADGQWKVSLTKNFIALSTHRYVRWEEFAKRLDFILAAFIRVYSPAFFVRVGLRYINAFNRKALGLDETPWRELIEPGYLGLMGDDDAQERAFLKNEQSITVSVPGGSKANIKCGPGVMRKVNNKTHETLEEPVYMLDLDLYMEGKTPINHAVPALNVVHGNAGSLFRGATTPALRDALLPTEE